jgi:DNA-binding NarL/FixJ family response regulator
MRGEHPSQNRVNGILIVDDNASMRTCVRDVLETQYGLDVCGEAENGYDGIEKAKELGPDLIVLDLAMPRMNGFQAAMQLKRLMPAIPLVMFTSFSGPQIEREATLLGIASVHSKSEGIDALVRAIRVLLAGAWKTAASSP